MRRVLLALCITLFAFGVSGQEAPVPNLDNITAEEAAPHLPPEMRDTGPMVSVRAFLSRAGDSPGVGFDLPEGSVACWEGGSLGRGRRTYPIDLSARPWGLTGNGRFVPSEYVRRYKGGNVEETGWPCGLSNELLQHNKAILDAACKGEVPELSYLVQPQGHNCNATNEEMLDLAVTERRCASSVYRTWHQVNPGGTADNPLDAQKWIARQEGWCESGVYSIKGLMCNWTEYYSVSDSLVDDAEWCEDRETPPLTEDDCETMEESRFANLCRSAPAHPDDLDKCAEKAERHPSSRLYSYLQDVCEDEETPTPPTEERTCHRWVPGEVSTERQEFVPGTPSTGRVEIELIMDGKWEEVPCE